MELNFTELFATIGRYLLSIHIAGYLDIAIMVFAFYKILTLVRSTKVESLLKGLFVFLAALFLSSVLRLHGINYVLSRLVDWGVLALIILFQPEIRRILEQMGSRRFMAFFAPTVSVDIMEQAISRTVEACVKLSQSHTGALIMFEREMSLDGMAVRPGSVLNADISIELLGSIFFVNTPLHDGAVIIRDGRIKGAGYLFPQYENRNFSKELGSRHLAGVGISANSDAVVVIVSEETGSISVAVGGMLKRHLTERTLETLLRNELLVQEDMEEDKSRFSVLNFLHGKKEEETTDDRKAR